MVLAGCSSDAGSGSASSPGSEPGDGKPIVQPAVALDGSYVVAWDGTGTKNGAPADDMNKARNGWVFRTACDENRCVATGGSIVDPNNPIAPLKNVRVADYVDGRWLIVNVNEGAATCDGPAGEKYTSDGWTIWDIAIAPDKTLTPTVTTVGTNDCPFVNVMSPTMTRVGDLLPGFPLTDPADQPQGKLPAAAAFRGAYTVTRTRRGQTAPREVTNHEVQTSCLRAEDRCVTTSTSRREPGAPFAEMLVYQFADDTFGRTSAPAGRPCDGGPEGMASEAETLPLSSAAPSDPLKVLTGERVTTFTSGCGGSVVDDVTYELTAD